MCVNRVGAHKDVSLNRVRAHKEVSVCVCVCLYVCVRARAGSMAHHACFSAWIV